MHTLMKTFCAVASFAFVSPVWAQETESSCKLGDKMFMKVFTHVVKEKSIITFLTSSYTSGAHFGPALQDAGETASEIDGSVDTFQFRALSRHYLSDPEVFSCWYGFYAKKIAESYREGPKKLLAETITQIARNIAGMKLIDDEEVRIAYRVLIALEKGDYYSKVAKEARAELALAVAMIDPLADMLGTRYAFRRQDEGGDQLVAAHLAAHKDMLKRLTADK